MGLLGFKLALLLAYLRITGFNRHNRKIIYMVMVLCTLNQLAFTFVLMFACSPVSVEERGWSMQQQLMLPDRIRIQQSVAGGRKVYQ